MKRITKIEKRYSMLTKLKHKSFISGYFQHPKVNRLMVSQPTVAIWLKDQPDYDDVFIKKKMFLVYVSFYLGFYGIASRQISKRGA